VSSSTSELCVAASCGLSCYDNCGNYFAACCGASSGSSGSSSSTSGETSARSS
jgi:hypothetical protein